jgi:hypothetical protein
MSDVLDHISTIVEDMETLAEDARDLIDLVFNTIGEQWCWPCQLWETTCFALGSI